MIVAVILSLMGLILIYLEFFLPGGIFALGGTILLLSSIFLLLIERIHVIYFLIYTFLLVFFAYSIIRFALKRVKVDQSIFPNSDHIKILHEKDLVGEIGVAFTDLKPTGKIFINETYYSATSNENFIEKGSKIQVIDGEGVNLIVRPFNKNF